MKQLKLALTLTLISLASLVLLQSSSLLRQDSPVGSTVLLWLGFGGATAMFVAVTRLAWKVHRLPPILYLVASAFVVAALLPGVSLVGRQVLLGIGSVFVVASIAAMVWNLLKANKPAQSQ